VTDPSQSYHFDHPDFFVGGAVGPPGQRVFHLQAGQDGEVVTLRCEKQHVVALAEHLDELLADLPPVAPDPGSRELREPLDDQWTVGGLGLAYEEDSDRVVLICEELIVVDTDDEEVLAEALAGSEGARARFAITRSQASAFIATAEELVQGGRARCQICGEPMDPLGHICPRSNGHRKH
jgi:uncharacterized repeat protein (TIGR03847 family)